MRDTLPRMVILGLKFRSCCIALATLGLVAVSLAAQEAQPLPAPADVAAAPPEAEVTASGLASKVLAAGSGTVLPVATDMVKVHYTGWTRDGKMFDSSVVRGRPIVLPLSKVIAGWTEGLQLMVEGEKRRFWIPAKLAYEANPDRPQGMLVFDIELLDILRVPEAPADVREPPADAVKSESGLAWRVLKPGTGSRHAGPKGVVRVHYTGWTTDGKRFDSSLAKGTPGTFNLGAVIPGWTEGIQLMVEGEQRRFWIPKKIAYRGEPGKPEGMLVFDVELLEIVKE
jgi:peptidylprolyl isomerase